MKSEEWFDDEGWLNDTHQCVSPNYTSRPDGCEISMLVIHNISLPPGQYGGGCIEQFFCNQLSKDAHPYFKEIADLEVSSHFLIDRLGAVTQFVGTEMRAWHAGRSEFQCVENCNDFSIGIELEGTDTEAYTDEQYASLARLSRTLIQRYPAITRDRIVGHSDIAPGRKTDPGEVFDWPRYRNALKDTNKIV